MAFSDIDKECLRDYHTYLMGLQRKRPLTTEEAADLDTILLGGEADKIAVAKKFAENIALTHVRSEIAGSSIRSPDLRALQIKEAELEEYLA
jgi:hypothetical protein